METRTDDFYPTRLERPVDNFARKDPVIHSQGKDRADGPLSETELARYERDGFLVFNNFLDKETVQRFRDDLRSYEDDDSILRSEGTITEPGKQEIRSIFGIQELSDRFDRLTRDRRICAKPGEYDLLLNKKGEAFRLPPFFVGLSGQVIDRRTVSARNCRPLPRSD